MQFRTVGGYTPFLPLQAVGNPTIDGLLGGYPGPLAVERLRVFLRRARVDQVVTLPGTGLPWRRTVHDALRPPAPAAAPLPHSISTAGADAEAPDGAANSGRVAAAWTQWDASCACGRIAVSFPARRASTTWVSSRGFEASDPRVAVSHDGRYAAAAWLEGRAGRLRIGLVRVVRDRVQHLTVRNVGQPVALSVGIDDRGRVTLAETVQHGARHVLVVQRLDLFGVASPPEQLSGSRGDASSPTVIDHRSEAFVMWRQLDATATSIHVETAPPGRALRQAAVIRDPASVLGDPRLGAGPDGITVAWLTGSGNETSTVRALSLDQGGRPLGRPVVVASDVLEGTTLAVAGDGRTVIISHALAALSKRTRVARVELIEHGSKKLLRIVAPRGWRVAGPAVPVAGAPVLAVPLAGASGEATLLEPLDKWWRRRIVSNAIDGQVLATHDGAAVLRTEGNEETHQVILQPLPIGR
jgi:hypothetical protein